MKKIITLIIALLATPAFASVNCLDNSEHQQYGDYDNKEWHSVECDCPCTHVKGGKCVECGHLQNAQPLTIIKQSIAKANQQSTIQGPQTVKEALNNLVRDYMRTH